MSTTTIIRTLREPDLPAADRIMRLAFGTFIGLPEPANFLGDADLVYSRWRSDLGAIFVAEMDGEVVGSNFVTNWGSVGFFGPLTVHPDLWDKGIGRLLAAPAMECFAEWGMSHAGLFTFASSPKHFVLYQKYGFWPRYLTAVMSKSVTGNGHRSEVSRFSALTADERNSVLKCCRGLTDAIYEGLDVNREIVAVAAQSLGETILLWEASKLVAFAVCHCGAATEAGGGKCYVKFGAVRPGPHEARHFEDLLSACETHAASQGLSTLVAGMNAAREQAFRLMLAKRFRIEIQGVVMERDNKPGYNRSGVYLIDDWR